MMKIIKLAILLMASTFAFAEVPQLINYQGVLTDAQGNPKLGPANLSFEIYSGPEEGATKLWGPQVFSAVPLINGSFNVILGSTDKDGNPIANAFQTANSYLQITENGLKIDPRQRILSAPFAMQAKTADFAKEATHATNADLATKSLDAVPIGTILAWHKSISPALPDGWVEMNGLQVPPGSKLSPGAWLDDLNGQVYANGRGKYLRGGHTTGLTNESSYYTDNGASYGIGYGAWRGAAAGRYNELDSSTSSQLTYAEGVDLGSGRRFQVAAMTVVWIIKVK